MPNEYLDTKSNMINKIKIRNIIQPHDKVFEINLHNDQEIFDQMFYRYIHEANQENLHTK
jgi:hypothetical protein